MNTASLKNVAAFITSYPSVWAVFSERADGLSFRSMEWAQERGSWVLVDQNGLDHAFRIYHGKVVAITSQTGNFVFVDGEAVAI